MCAEVEGPRNLPSRPGEAGNQRRAGSVTTPGGQDGWGAGAGLSQARWGVASEPGVGARTKPWPREGTGAVAATPRRPGSHSGDDPRHATRPSFPRGLGCVREVALLALRKSKRLPTPEAFRPPQSLKKFISHHRGGGMSPGEPGGALSRGAAPALCSLDQAAAGVEGISTQQFVRRFPTQWPILPVRPARPE